MRWKEVATTPDAIARLLARRGLGSGPGPDPPRQPAGPSPSRWSLGSGAEPLGLKPNQPMPRPGVRALPHPPARAGPFVKGSAPAERARKTGSALPAGRPAPGDTGFCQFGSPT
jgi:hypothetical protein